MAAEQQPDTVHVIGREGSFYVIVTRDGVESEIGPYDDYFEAYDAEATQRQALGLPKRLD